MHILNDIYMVPGVFYDCNVYIIKNRKELTLIDVGTGKYFENLIKEIKQLGLDISNVKSIILTHSHYDHSGGAYLFNSLDVKIYVSAIEAPFLERGDSNFTLDKFFGEEFIPVKVDYKLKDGDIIEIGDMKLKVLYTPGHTIGSICLYEENLQVLFSGDTVFSDGNIGRIDFPTSDPAAIGKSLEKLSTLNVKFLMPGHGGITNDGNKCIKQALKLIHYYL